MFFRKVIIFRSITPAFFSWLRRVKVSCFPFKRFVPSHPLPRAGFSWPKFRTLTPAQQRVEWTAGKRGHWAKWRAAVTTGGPQSQVEGRCDDWRATEPSGGPLWRLEGHRSKWRATVTTGGPLRVWDDWTATKRTERKNQSDEHRVTETTGIEATKTTKRPQRWLKGYKHDQRA